MFLKICGLVLGGFFGEILVVRVDTKLGSSWLFNFSKCVLKHYR